MNPRRMLQLLTLLVCAVALTPRTAQADGIRAVTGGVVSTVNRDAATVVLLGDSFFISGRFSEGIGDALACHPCGAGDTVPLASTWAGTIPATNVVTNVDGHAATDVFLAGGVFLEGGSFVVPDTDSSLLFIQRPFALRPESSIIGYSDSARMHQVFNFGLTGSGIVTFTAQRNGSLFDRGHLTWVFTSLQPSPTPEPASALLLLTGLGGLAVAWRRQRLAA